MGNIIGVAAVKALRNWINTKLSGKSDTGHKHSASDITSGLATVATSGSYNDLSNKPTIPSLSGYATETWVTNQGYTKNTGTYSKPSGGIPKSDLASAVQTSLGKADTALQSYTEQYKGTVTQVKVGTSAYNPSSGIVSLPAYPTTLPASDVSSWAKAANKPSYSWNEISGKPIPLTLNESSYYGATCWDCTSCNNFMFDSSGEYHVFGTETKAEDGGIGYDGNFNVESLSINGTKIPVSSLIKNIIASNGVLTCTKVDGSTFTVSVGAAATFA